jgi:hypothetical protein
VVGVENSQSNVTLPVSNVPRCIGSNAKTLGLQYLLLHNVGARGGPQDGTRVVHHGMDELLIQQNNFPDGEVASHVEERMQFPYRPCRFLSHLIGMCRPGEPFIKGSSKDNGRYRPIGLAPRTGELIGVSGRIFRS